ncbi:hypothetical protein ACFXDJ_15305 [Streptomyces sp. NPDC059443]|uniref:hypothetical protein n=1 Tax=unclassified Streptomyces TaxID=2593676 RepID=UPI0036B4C96B
MELRVDHRWLLERQEALFKDVEVADHSALVAAVARHGVDAPYEQWRELITDIRTLRTTVFDVADRLRSWQQA